MISDFIKNAEKNIKKRSEIPEIQIEDYFTKKATQLGCTVLKLVIVARRGFVDKSCFCPGGYIFFIEFKRKNKPLQKHQEDIRDMLIEKGFKYFKIDSMKQADKLLNIIRCNNKGHS